MEDKILGVIKDCECPKCGSKNVVCYMQYPLQVKLDLKGKIIRKNPRTGERMKLSNEWKAAQFDYAMCNFQVAQYECEQCGWNSKPYTP